MFAIRVIKGEKKDSMAKIIFEEKMYKYFQNYARHQATDLR